MSIFQNRQHNLLLNFPNPREATPEIVDYDGFNTFPGYGWGNKFFIGIDCLRDVGSAFAVLGDVESTPGFCIIKHILQYEAISSPDDLADKIQSYIEARHVYETEDGYTYGNLFYDYWNPANAPSRRVVLNPLWSRRYTRLFVETRNLKFSEIDLEKDSTGQLRERIDEIYGIVPDTADYPPYFLADSDVMLKMNFYNAHMHVYE